MKHTKQLFLISLVFILLGVAYAQEYTELGNSVITTPSLIEIYNNDTYFESEITISNLDSDPRIYRLDLFSNDEEEYFYYFYPDEQFAVLGNTSRTVYLYLRANQSVMPSDTSMILVVDTAENSKEILINMSVIDSPQVVEPPVDTKTLIIILIVLIVLLILSLLCFIFWIFMVYDSIHRDFEHKLRWLLILNLVPLGYVFYYFMVKRPNKGKRDNKESNDTLALISYVLGVGAAVIPIYFGFFLGIPSIILALISKKHWEDKKFRGKELAKAGLWLSVAGMVLTILFFVAYFGFIIAIVSMNGFD